MRVIAKSNHLQRVKRQQCMTTRGSYVHKPTCMVTFWGASQKCYFFCNFLKILMVSDKAIHKAFRTHLTISKSDLIIFFFSLMYQNYTLALTWAMR